MPTCILVLASIHHLQRWCVSFFFVCFFVLRLNMSDSHFLFVIFHILCGIWLPLSASILSFLCPACAIMAITDQITKSFRLCTIMDVHRRLDDIGLLHSHSIWRRSEHVLSILMKSCAGWCGPGPWETDLCREGTVTLTLELPLDFFVYYVGGTAICWNQKDGGWDFLEKMCNAHNLFTWTSFNMHWTLVIFEETKEHLGNYLTLNPEHDEIVAFQEKLQFSSDGWSSWLMLCMAQKNKKNKNSILICSP